MTGTEEAFARKGKVAPLIVWRKSDRKNFRSLYIAAVAAAIFVCADSAPVSARMMMSQNVVQASGGFDNLISTICWLVGLCFIVNGCVKIRRAARFPADDPAHKPLWRRGILYLFLGLGCLFFPYVQSAMQGTITGWGYQSPRTIIEHDLPPKLISILCWYFSLAFLLNGDLALREALRLKDTPAAAGQKIKMAICFVAGVALLAVPAVYSLWLALI